MTIVNVPVPNLINGVSQQPKGLRFDSQVEEMVNCYPSVTQGLMRRPAIEHVADVDSYGAGGNRRESHFVDRDDNEKYIITVASDGALAVFDLNTGSLLHEDFTETVSGGALHHSQAELDAYSHNLPLFDFATINDYTFIWSRAKTVALVDHEKSSSYAGRGYIWIRTAAPNTNYYVRIYLYDENGNDAGSASTSYTSGNTNNHSTIADGIAANLYSDLHSHGWAVVGVGEIVRISPPFVGYRCAVVVENTDIMTGWSTISPVRSIEQLPINGIFDSMALIEGTSDKSSYWVKFETTYDRGYATGSWVETPALGTKYRLDPDTMPVAVRRLADGTWETIKPDWGQLLTGRATGEGYSVSDGISNPPPDFVGRRIISVFQRKGRLGFLADNGVIAMSEVGNIFNFWRTTMQTLLDSDPISIIASSTKPVTWVGYEVFDQQFIMIATDAQFILSEGEVLSPKSVSADKISEYITEGHSPPIVVGKNMILPFQRGDFVGVRELALDRLSGRVDAVETTRHVPHLIKGRPVHMAGSSSENVVIIFCGPVEKKTNNGTYTSYPLYVYNYYDGPGEQNGQLTRLQSAWHVWETSNILSPHNYIGDGIAFKFIGSTLYFFNTQRIAKMELGGYFNDPGTGTLNEMVPHAPLLDERIHFHKETPGVRPYREYDAVTDRTVFYMPTWWGYLNFDANDWEPAVFMGGWPDMDWGPDDTTFTDIQRGQEAEIVPEQSTGTAIYVEGDWYRDGYLSVQVGVRYPSRVRLTTPPNSRATSRGSHHPSTTVKGNIAYLHLTYDNTTAFDVTVQYGDFNLETQVNWQWYVSPKKANTESYHTAQQAPRTTSFRYYDTLMGPNHPNYFEQDPDIPTILTPLTTSGEFTVDVSGDPDQCRVTISSDHVLGFQFISAEWEKLAHARGRQGR